MRRAWIRAWAASIGAAACLSGTAVRAQEAPKEEAKPQVERLEAWPKLPQADRTKKDIERLRRATTENMGVEASTALIADGAGVVPLLLPIYGKEKNEDALERILVVLDSVTGPPHANLIARDFLHRATNVRTWALGRAATFADRTLAPEAEAALARVVRKGEKGDREELYRAGLCAVASGSLAGMDAVNERARTSWKKSGPEIRAALASVRGPEATAKVAADLSGKPREAELAALRLLAGCGDASATGSIRRFLDHEDNQLRVEAINALRGIVDGEPPFENLPVFDAIEMAGKWKERLGGKR